VGGGGLGPVVAVVVGAVVVGSGAVVVAWMLEAPGEVATTVSFAELERSASQIAETTPAPAATRRASSVGQIQSPGYQPSRRRHADPRNATAPVVAGSRWPHSRQYSCPSPYGVPQRGQRRSSCGPARAYRSQGSVRSLAAWTIVSSGAGGPASGSRSYTFSPVGSSGGSAGRPQLAQKLASAGSGWPQPAQATTGSPPTGRPQLAQKWEPHGTGAPQSQVAGARRATATASSIESSSCKRCSSATISRHCSISSSSRKFERRYISRVSPPRWRIRSSRALTIARRSRRRAPGEGARRRGGEEAARSESSDRRRMRFSRGKRATRCASLAPALAVSTARVRRHDGRIRRRTR
jgi:hypothetical protein